jgi:hypothetical protein
MAVAIGCTPAIASQRPGQRIVPAFRVSNVATPLPGNAIKREDILLSRSLDDLDRYLSTLSDGASPIGSHNVERKPDETLLKWAMRTHGFEWRGSDEAFTFGRWRLPYLLNPAGREAIDNLMVRAMVARSMERTFAEGAGADIAIRRDLPPRNYYWMQKWLKLGRKFAGHFPLQFALVEHSASAAARRSESFRDLDRYLTILSNGGRVGIRKLEWDGREPILAWGMRTYGLHWRASHNGSHRTQVEAKIEKAFANDVIHAWMYHDISSLKRGIAEIRRLMTMAQ